MNPSFQTPDELRTFVGGRKKILLCVTGCLAFIFLLLIGLVFLLPYLINLEPIKEKILTLLSQHVEGKVEFQKIDLFYFPRPGVEVHRVSLSIPENVAGTLESVRVYPELLPILKGKLRIAKIQIESPDVTIRFPMEREEGKEKPGATVLERFKEITARASGMVPDIRLVVNGGKLKVAQGYQTVFSFSDINASMTGSPRDAKIELSCRSNLWEKISVEAKMNPVSLQGYGRIEVESFYPHLLAASLFSGFPLNVKDSKLNLKVSFEAKGQGVYQAAVEGSMGRLIVGKGNEEIAIKGKRFQGTLQMGEERTEISLDELSLEYPRLTLFGKIKIDQKAPLFDVEVQGREVDVTSTREVALLLAGEIPITKKVFDIVRGGQVPLISFQSSGRSMADLDETENFSIQGGLQEGSISLSEGIFASEGINFDLEKVTGDVVISKGILEGKNVRARLGKEEIREGKLRVGLEGENAPFHVEVVSEVDLATVAPLLGRLIKDEAFLKELARTHDIQGKAVGRLILGESTGSIGAKVEISEMNLLARYAQVPYPLEIDRGQFSFDGGRIGLNHLSGKVGESSFSELTVQLSLGKERTLEILSGDFSVSLEETYLWLASLEGLRESLKEIKAIKGTLGLTVNHLSGPLQNPQRWRFEATGKVTGLSGETPLLPEPIAIAGAAFKADQEKLSFAEVQTNILGASFNLSGDLAGYVRGPFQLELRSPVDLAQLPPVLRHVLKDDAFEKELSLIENLKGHAMAKLVLDGVGGRRALRVEASKVSASANYRRVPYLLVINNAEVSFGEEKIGVTNLGGTFGRSSFSELQAQFTLGKEPYVEIVSGKLAMVLDEIYPWLSSQESLRDVLKDLHSVTGTIRLSEVNLIGPLLRPRDWHFETAGDVNSLVLNSTFLPGPVTIASGRFNVDLERAVVSDLGTKVLDASLDISGTLYAYQQGLEKAEMDFGGRVTPKDLRWLADFLHLKTRIPLRAPLSISGAHLSWHKGSQTSFKGELNVEDGPQISVDILQNSHELKVNQLLIRDEWSRAVIGLDVQARTVGLTFSGELSEKTLDKIFSGYQSSDGWVKGDLEAHILWHEPMESTARGNLEAKALSFPWQFEKPLEIEHISLVTKGNHVSVSRGAFDWGGRRFSVSGGLDFSGEKVWVDMDVSTDNLDVGELIEAEGGEKEDQQAQGARDLPVQGLIRFKSKSLTYDRFTWAPFQAEISFIPDRVRVNVIEANLCGISTPGTLEMSSQDLSLDVQTLSRNEDLNSTIVCLLERHVRMTGSLDLNGRLQGQGKSNELIQSLRGGVELDVRKGRIYQFDLLSTIFSFLNITDVLMGRLPDFGQEGLVYDSIKVKAGLQSGKIVIEEAVLAGPTVEIACRGEIDPIGKRIDLTVLVAPFRTVDYVVSRIPLLRYVLGGTLISMPVKVTGDWESPRVDSLSPSAVGSELLGIMGRTLEVPFRLIDPFLPRKEGARSAP